MFIAIKSPESLSKSLLKKSKAFRLSIFGIPAIILFVLMYISVPIVENYRTSILKQAEEERIQAIEASVKNTCKRWKS